MRVGPRTGLAPGLALALLAAGCATAPPPPPRVETPAPPPPHVETPAPPALTDLYVLLPSEDGQPGALVVSHGGQERTLAMPHEAVRIEQPGTMQTARVNQESVAKDFGAALGAQPPRPMSFVLFFQVATDEFTPESSRVVEDVVTEIARRPAPEVIVIGHTDTMGADDFNDQLSLQRAERVRSALIQQGIAADRIQAVGRGKRELLVPTADQVPEPRNRRVEIVVR